MFKSNLIDKPVNWSKLSEIAIEGYEIMVKAVVDISKNIMSLGAEMHADDEVFLIEQGSEQEDLWGINIYTDGRDDWLIYDSMINIRPRQNNRSRYVEDENIREKIKEVVNSLIEK